jgi:hypothetical protein
MEELDTINSVIDEEAKKVKDLVENWWEGEKEEEGEDTEEEK